MTFDPSSLALGALLGASVLALALLALRAHRSRWEHEVSLLGDAVEQLREINLELVSLRGIREQLELTRETATSGSGSDVARAGS